MLKVGKVTQLRRDSTRQSVAAETQRFQDGEVAQLRRDSMISILTLGIGYFMIVSSKTNGGFKT